MIGTSLAHYEITLHLGSGGMGDVTPDGKVKVLDFGLAKAVTADETESSLSSPTMSLAATQRGVILGTAAYMSPEQRLHSLRTVKVA